MSDQLSRPDGYGALCGGRVGTFAVRLVRALALLAVAVSVLVYPLRFDDALMASLGRLAQRCPGGWDALRAVTPYLTFGFSPLTIKEVLTAWVLLVLVAVWCTWKLALAPPRRHRFQPQYLFLILFLAWGLASVYRAPQFGVDSDSVYTAFNLVLWVLFGIALSDLPYSRRFARLSARWLLFLGLILMLVSVGEAVKGISGYVFRVMPRLDAFYKRNLYGSLIGHNTGVASACLGPFFFAVGALLRARGVPRRLLLSGYVALGIFFFLVTESRAVWILLVVLTPPFLWGLRSVIGISIRVRHVLIGLFLAVLFITAQFFPYRWNLLHIQDAPFRSRLEAFTPRVLITETRLRILAVCLPLVDEKPLLGHGLSSFVSVYPKAQGDYFAEHPDSVLYPTFHLTEQAHNDYLQLILETGLLGFALAAAAGYFFFRRGLERFRRLRSPDERLRRYCAGFALGGILLHALVDFPFHVVPLATCFILYCALAYGAPEEDDGAAGTPANEPGGDASHPPELAALTVRPAKVVVLVVIFGFWAATVPAMWFTARRLQADVYLCRACSFFLGPLGAQTGGTGNPAAVVRDLLQRREDLRLSLRIDPLGFTARFYRAMYDYLLARVYADEARTAEARGASRQAQLARADAARFARSALSQFYQAGAIGQGAKTVATREAPGARVNHNLFYYIGLNWRLMGELGAASEEEASRNAFRYYQLAVRYSPTFSDAVVELIDFMGAKRLGSSQLARHYLGLLARYSRPSFEGVYLARVRGLSDQERYDAAESLLLDLREAVKGRSDYPEVSAYLVRLYEILRDPARHHAALEEMRARFPSHPDLPVLTIDDLILFRRYPEAQTAVEALPASGRKPDEPLLLTQAELLKALGRAQEGEALSQRVLESSHSPAQAYASRGHVRLYLFNDQAGALKDFEKAVASPPAGIPSPVYFHLMRACADRGDWQAVARVYALAKERIPNNPALKRLRSELAARPGGSALPQ